MSLSRRTFAITKRVVDRARAKGISVGAELGMLDRVEQGRSLLRSTPISIAHRNEKLGSAGQLDTVRASVKKQRSPRRAN